jgi:hypothetical protein
MASESFSSRGHLILKSHKPLPKFSCAIPVPPSDTSIQQLRSTIVAILTGQVSARPPASTSNSNGNGTSGGLSSSAYGGAYSKGGGSGAGAGDTGLSYSEHLKQVTIHEWRMKSIVLELRQNAIIAPETRESAHEDDDDDVEEEKISGFELQDDHECGLLEHGDEVK